MSGRSRAGRPGRPARILMINETPVAKDERAWLEARTLSRAGYDVTVVCPLEQAGGERLRVQDGVTVRAYPPPPTAHGFWGHSWELAYCWIRSAALALRIAVTRGFDVLHACNPPDTFFLLAAFCKLFGARFVFAEHDLVPELWFSRYAETGWRSRLVHRVLLWMERLSHRLADAVIVPNESYERIAMQRGAAPSSVHVVRNGPDLEKLGLVPPDPSLKGGREHLVCYLGIMNPQDGVDYLLRAAAHLVHDLGREDVQFALVGAGDMDDELRRLARELAIEPWITFTGWVSDGALLSRYLCTADVCVAPDPKTPLNEVSSFMKIMDYMAAAKPVVAFDLPETRVSAGEAGSYARPDDVGEFALRIADLLSDPALRARMGAAGRARIDGSLSWAHQEPILLGAYRGLVGAPAGSAVEHLVAAPATVAPPPVVAVDTLEGKRAFLEFWRVPWVPAGDGPAGVSLLSGRGLDDLRPNSVMLLPGDGPRRLHATGDGMAVFASVHAIDEPPPGFEVVSPLLDGRGRTVSYILRHPAACSYVIPFSLDDAIEGLERERYANGRRFPPPGLLAMYYAVKPVIPRTVILGARRSLAWLQGRRDFPRWPFDDSLERLRRLVLELLLRASVTGELPFIWFWPGEKRACAVLTHDVETGLVANDGIARLVAAEREAGLRSAFNVVPFKYEVPPDAIDRVRAYGCEVGVHGHSHDGDLFVNRTRFRQRAEQLREVARAWGARGFRSSSTYRDPDLIETLGFDYDCSFFDTDPFEPQPGGSLSLFPYFLGDVVEIPMTLPQDITLFTVLGEHDGRVWSDKLAAIRRLNAMACLDVHPDAGYVADADKIAHYERLLAEIASDGGFWNPLPGELARWWRERREASIVMDGGEPGIAKASAGMTVRYARIEDGSLAFALPAVRQAG